MASFILSFPILLSEQITAAVKEAESFKFECSAAGKQVERLCQMLSSAALLATAGSDFYDRPLRRIAVEVSKNLERSLTLAKKCRRRVVTIVSAADFRKLLAALDSYVADMKWALRIFDVGSGIVLTLPPIASNELASLARDNDRNEQIIVEEGHGMGGMGGLLAGGAAAAAYGAHHMAHGAYRPHGGFFSHHGKFKHGKFRHGKFGKRWKHGMYGKNKFMKRWK